MGRLLVATLLLVHCMIYTATALKITTVSTCSYTTSGFTCTDATANGTIWDKSGEARFVEMKFASDLSQKRLFLTAPFSTTFYAPWNLTTNPTAFNVTTRVCLGAFDAAYIATLGAATSASIVTTFSCATAGVPYNAYDGSVLKFSKGRRLSYSVDPATRAFSYSYDTVQAKSDGNGGYTSYSTSSISQSLTFSRSTDVSAVPLNTLYQGIASESFDAAQFAGRTLYFGAIIYDYAAGSDPANATIASPSAITVLSSVAPPSPPSPPATPPSPPSPHSRAGAAARPATLVAALLGLFAWLALSL